MPHSGIYVVIVDSYIVEPYAGTISFEVMVRALTQKRSVLFMFCSLLS